MMHHNTKFGNKKFGGLEDIWTNIIILTSHCALGHEYSNQMSTSAGVSHLGAFCEMACM